MYAHSKVATEYDEVIEAVSHHHRPNDNDAHPPLGRALKFLLEWQQVEVTDKRETAVCDGHNEPLEPPGTEIYVLRVVVFILEDDHFYEHCDANVTYTHHTVERERTIYTHTHTDSLLRLHIKGSHINNGISPHSQ